MSYDVNLTECAELLEITTETLRKYVAKAAENGFPIKSRGSNGVEYVIDARDAVEWWKGYKDKADAVTEGRASELAQLRFDLMGGTVSAGESERLKLSGLQREQEMKAELRTIEVRLKHLALIERVEAEVTVAAALTALRQDLLALPDQLARRLSLPRDVRNSVDAQIRAALHRYGDRLAGFEEQILTDAA